MLSSLVLTACGSEGSTGDSTGAATEADPTVTTEASSSASTADSSSSSSSTSDATTSSGSSSENGDTTIASADASAEESDEQSGTGEPGGPCSPGDLELGDVVLDVTTNRVMDEDVATPFDPAQGSSACVQVAGSEAMLFVQYGPFDFDGLQSSLQLTVSAVGEYDLATDAGIPGSGMGGEIELSYSYDFEPATSASYSTQNQAATGTLDVTAIPTDGGTTFEFSAQGEIAGADGWQFDLSFTGTVVRGG